MPIHFSDVNTAADITTQGFDLDAIPDHHEDIPSEEGQDNADIIYELGGGATTTTTTATTTPATHGPTCQGGPSSPLENNDNKNDKDSSSSSSNFDPIAASEEFKQKGNEFFKQGNYLDAIDYYTDAIEVCPGMKEHDILLLQEQHEEKEREKANQRYRRETDRRMANRNISKDRSSSDAPDSSNQAKDMDQSDEQDEEDDLAPQEFQLPVHPYGKYLAIYYSNKAASLIQLGRYSEALTCCNLAILVDSTYSKAYIRRMTCHEQTQATDLALQDAKKALELHPGNGEIRKHVARLEKLEAERMETLKKETMEKLKGLGNSILGNFGMSLDNFKAEKDPKTGSYSIRMV